MAQMVSRSWNSSITAPADWQLPRGVSRGVWDYLHDSTASQGGDESEPHSPLLTRDLDFTLRRLPAGGGVLDLGCGPGRAAIGLAQRGWRVVGVDLSAAMLRTCAARCASAGVAVERIQANIVDLDFLKAEAFDAAICLFSTWGMVSGAENRQRVVDQAARVLRTGGVFIVHALNRLHHWRTATGRRWLIRDFARRIRRSPLAGDSEMPHAPDRPGWTMHLFTRREVCRHLTAAGLTIDAIEPLSLHGSGRLTWPRWLPGLRAYGFLAAARKPP